MSYFSTSSVNKPRKLSKKKKEELKEQKKIQNKIASERKNYWKTASPLTYKLPVVEDRNKHLEIHYGATVVPFEKEIKETEYNEEMVEREKKAKLVTEELKKMTAPLYNKGGYQYIGHDPEVIKNLGKKV